MNERELIEHVRLLSEQQGQGLIQGIGDDCAVVEKDQDHAWLLTMDTLVESIHFNCAWHPPELLGRKAVAVNVSDVAAMGGRPLFALLSLGLPVDFAEEWAVRLAQGIAEACRLHSCLLVGGDTVCSPDRVCLSLAVIGEMRKDQVLYRHNAQLGDTVWTSGPLGRSAAGLALLQAGKRLEDREWQTLIRAHLDPQPRAELALLLARTGLVHAMMDMSDGLATDLAHVCARSGVGARVWAERLPGRSELSAAAELLGVDPLPWMTEGGEDYELLLTTASEDGEQLRQLAAERNWTLHSIGTIVEGQGVQLIRSNGYEVGMSFQGFDHFGRVKRTC